MTGKSGKLGVNGLSCVIKGFNRVIKRWRKIAVVIKRLQNNLTRKSDVAIWQGRKKVSKVKGVLMGKTMGRPKIKVNWDKFETACNLFATKQEICDLLNVKDQTLQRRIKEKYNTTFEGVLKRLNGNAKLSLRRNQLKLSETNAGMAIFLGKNYLDQSDKNEAVAQHTDSLSDIAKAIRETDEK